MYVREAWLVPKQDIDGTLDKLMPLMFSCAMELRVQGCLRTDNDLGAHWKVAPWKNFMAST